MYAHVDTVIPFCHLNSQISIKAAPNEETNAITSVLLWDGNSDAFGEFEADIPTSLAEEVCSCCYDIPFNKVWK